jgi:hypothetical protein
MSTLWNYRVWCATDNKHEYIWREAENYPSTCPTNTSHTIDAAQTVVVEIRDPNLIQIKEEFIPTQGFFQSVGSRETIDGNVNTVSAMTHSFPYSTTLLDGWFYSTAENVGDDVSVEVAGITIGATGAPVAVNDKEITVTSTVIDNTSIGFHLTLTDGVNSSDMGRVLGIDSANSIVTMETGSEHIFSPLSPTYVQQTVRLIDSLPINTPNVRYAFAEKKMGGKNLPPNVPVTISYHNKTGGEKEFAYNMEIIY